MNEFNRKYGYTLTALTPLHIGTGEAMTPLEYFIGDDLIVPEIDRVFAKHPATAEKFVHQLGAKSAEKLARVGLGQLIGDEVLNDPEVCRYKVAPFISKPNSFDSLNELENRIESGQANVKLAIKTHHSQAYVPGSSIKGAFKTAWLYQQCKQDNSLLGELSRRALNESETSAEAYAVSRLLHAPSQPGDDWRKIRRDKDAAYDVFRALQISDTESKPADEALVLLVEDVLSSPVAARDGAAPAAGDTNARFKNYPIFLEAIDDQRLSFSGRLLFAERLLKDQVAQRVMGWNRAQTDLTLGKLVAAVNEFAADLCQWEIEFFERIPDHQRDCDIEDVLTFYDQLKEDIAQASNSPSTNTCYFSLGHGSGWHKLTIGLLLEKRMGRETFQQLREKFDLAKYRPDNEFPKSRKLVMHGHRIAYRPFGWVKMEIAEAKEEV